MSERRGEATRRERASVPDDWRTRMRHAADALDSPRHMAELTLSIRKVELFERPAAEALVGRGPLAAARAVGLFAGSFNPLTQAHVALAEAARATGTLDVIAWMLAVETINKERVERATLADRLAQLEAYADRRGDSSVVVVNRGLYVDQARALRELMSPGARLAIIVGYDKVLQIFDPRYYADRDAALAALFAEAELLVAPRAGSDRRDVEQLLGRPENARFAGAVRLIPLPPEYAAESSSQVRTVAAATSGRAPRALVTPEGWALARLGAYVAEDDPSRDSAAYTIREAWEQALPGLPVPLLRVMPALAGLVRRTQEPSGIALRGWLDARHAGPEALAQLLD